MGIMHFAGLGKSPGAVTAGLAYIKNKYGLHDSQYGDMVESVLIFTSDKIVNGEEQAFASIHNDYMTTSGRKTWTERQTNSLQIVAEYMRREFPDTSLYVVRADLNNYDACFDAVGRTVVKFHRPNDTGKHIWANITGGTNVINAAIMQAAYLSGFIGRLYYTFVADVKSHGKYLQPFSRKASEFRYDEIFTFKTSFGLRYQRVLEVLEQINNETSGRYISSKELLGRLKGKFPQDFQTVSSSDFKNNFLNVMVGRGIEQRGNRQEGQEDAVRLSDDGRKVLDFIRQPLFRALVRREQLADSEIEEVVAKLNLEPVL